ncbi:unnamed protein product [Camellia sinensis]
MSRGLCVFIYPFCWKNLRERKREPRKGTEREREIERERTHGAEEEQRREEEDFKFCAEN